MNKTHVLNKLEIEVTAPSLKDGAQFSNTVSNFVQDHLIKNMEEVFDKVGGKTTIRIPRLEIELKDINMENWQEEVLHQFSKKLLLGIQDFEDQQRTSNQDHSAFQNSNLDTLIYFLKNGTTPWWSNSLNINDLKLNISQELESKDSVLRLKKSLSENSGTVKRLVFQLDNKMLEFIFGKLISEKTDTLPLRKSIVLILSKWWTRREIRNQTWISIFNIIVKKEANLKNFNLEILNQVIRFFSKKNKIAAGRKIDELYLIQQLDGVLKKNKIVLEEDLATFFKIKNNTFTKNKNTKPTSSQHPSKPTSANLITSKEKEGWYINNAGLVILHPFFQYLFEDFKITKDLKFVNLNQQHQATLLLQYLINGNSEAIESDLILNKILCNIPIEEPIDNQLIFEKEKLIESEALLTATIKHWSALKNTSPDGLRNTFLKREGKITKREDGDWLLQIQSNAVDILLAKLPWGIGIIKLPWMDNKLIVDWQ